MARIRSIKPEFWKSEAIAAHTFRARLTFIGLWTYVDDNGVGIDNPKLIAAELFALEDDPREALANVREDLARLHEAGRIVRYTVDGKSYLAVVNWREHQKIDKPGKPRYPEPDDPRAVHAPRSTSTNTEPREFVAKPSRESRETVAEPPCLDQGSGNREQGVPPTAERSTALALVKPLDNPQALIGEWIDHCRKRPPATVIGQVGKQIKAMLDEGIDPADVRRGLAAWHSKGLNPSVLPSVVNELMNATVRTGAASSLSAADGQPLPAGTGNSRMTDVMRLAAHYDALDGTNAVAQHLTGA